MELLQRILTYPFWRIGSVSLSLLGILKFLLVLVLGLMGLRFLRRRMEGFLVRRIHLQPNFAASLTTLAYYLLALILVLVALSSAGINLTQVGILLGALGVGIGFGLQSITSNFIAGIILLTEGSLRIGDLVEFEDGTMGVVKKISMRATIIRTFDGQDLIVPNSEFIAKRISTWTYEDDWRRLRIPFGVAYGSDPRKVEEVATRVARRIPLTEEDPDHPIRVWFDGFGDSSLNFSLVVWIRQSKVQRAISGIKSDYYYALYQALQEAGIEIPFPQRDLHLRSISPDAARTLRTLSGGEA
ncbi:mechanosensitive ion channel domain-containing protein [Thermosulfurimonas sp.]|uniref:mechanosensitive ion channel family protein n=1 Tax=Thermosulfurimonas sp. TaxID=2080236 RepID=UPI0025EE491B|nr:mechanosensitive ion channel domain-containing protein [Thermosulfurimonas sp.]